MSTDTHYHDQPHTLDPNVEIKDDAPKAQGHDDDRAADVREAVEEHTQAVKDQEGAEEVTARAPGDHAGSDDSDDSVPNGTIEEVKAWVGDDHARAQQALEAERNGQNRATLISYLEGV